jgi:Ca2+-binding RTX toxin-like protein
MIFTGPSELQALKQLIVNLFKLNESKQPYSLTFAGGNSGFSFGYPQFDLGQGDAALNKEFVSILTNATDVATGQFIVDSNLTGTARTAAIATLAALAETSGNKSALTRAQLLTIDSALSSTYGELSIDSYTDQYLTATIEKISTELSGLVPADEAFGYSNLFQLLVVDTLNWIGPNARLASDLAEASGAGLLSAYGGFSLGAAMLDYIQYKKVNSGKVTGPAQALRRIANVVATAGGYTPLNVQDARGVIEAFSALYLPNELSFASSSAATNDKNSFVTNVLSPTDAALDAGLRGAFGTLFNPSSFGSNLYVGLDNASIFKTGSALDASGDGANDILIAGSGTYTVTAGGGNDVLIAGTGNDILKAGAGNDTLIAGGGDSSLFGGSGGGNATLEGGAGSDAFVFVAPTAGLGTTQNLVETIISGNNNNTGSVRVGSTQITGPGAFATVSVNGLVATWTSTADGTQYQYTVANAGATTGTLTISQGVLANGDEIVIDNFNLDQAENSSSGYLGIQLTSAVALFAGTPTVSQLFGGAESAVTASGAEETLTIYASNVSSTAQTVTLNASGASGDYLSLGSDLVSLSGPVTLEIPAGQDSVTVNLIDPTASTQPQTVQLTATLDDGGSNAAVSNTLSVTFAGTPAAASDSTVISGVAQQHASGSAYEAPLILTTVYTLDDGNDQVTARSGVNFIAGSPPVSTLDGMVTPGNSNGNSTIAGGGGQDIIMTGNGDNQIYAGSVESLSEALSQQQGATASNATGDFIGVGNGDNSIVGSNGNDFISVGTGDNVIVDGAGQDTFSGGTTTEYAYEDWSTSFGPGFTYLDAPDVINSNTRLDSGIISAGNTSVPAGFDGDYIGGAPSGTGNDTIYGGSGDSVYYLSNGNNYLDAGGGNDQIGAGSGENTIFGGSGNDSIDGGGGDNYIDTESGNDIVALLGGDSTVFGGTGNDTILSGDIGADWATSRTGTNYLEAGSGDTALFGAGGSDTLIGGSGNDSLYAGAGTEYLEAGSGDAVLEGGAGTDTLIGGDGEDTLIAGDGNTTLQAGDGNTSIVGGAGDDIITAGSGNDSINAGSGDTTITGGTGSDTIFGGSGTDVISAGDGGTDSNPTYVTAGSGATTITGGAGIDYLFGGSGTDVIYAGDGGDADARTQVTAGDGDSTIYGGTGVDNILGGDGNDVIYAGDGGTTDDPTLVTAGSGDTTIYGGAGVSQITTGSGDDTLIAGSGTNTFVGGAGTATYEIGNDSGTTDIWYSTASDTLEFGAGVSIADLTVSQTTYANGVAVTFTTPGGASVTIEPDALNQVSFSDGTSATIAELLSSTFTVGNTTYSSVNGALTNVDTTTDTNPATQSLTLTGTNDLTATGNNVNDVITANSGNDTLTAGTANDTLIGGGSSDDYVVSAGSGTVTTIESSSSADTLSFTAGTTLADLSVSTATAADGSTTITLQDSQGGTVVLDGVDSAAANSLDQLSFADGSTASLDELVAQLATGPTAATSASTVTLASGIQNMTLTGSSNIAATANSQDDVITANGGNDTLIAGTGNDTLSGGGGTATYEFNTGDGNLVISNSGSSDTLQLGAGIDESNLTTSSAVVDGQTVITIADDQGSTVTIDGGTLSQVSFADGSSATISQLLGTAYSEGSTTYSTVSATAGDGVTTLDMTGSANVTATANSLDDTLVANSGNDTLIAGAGNDTLVGGGGADTYVIAAGTQTTTVQQSGFADTLSFGAGVVLADLSATEATAADGSNVITIQNSLGDSIIIDASADGPLDQLAFADGSTGSLSALLAQATTGTSAATSAVDVTLAEGTQNMILTGSADLTATANDQADVITANSGNDTLIAGLGDDTFVGGSGSTTYDVAAGEDVTIAGSASTDTLAYDAGISESDLTTGSAVVNGVTVVTITDDQGGSVEIDGGGLSQVSFADGSTATLAQLLSPAYTIGTATYSTVSTTAGSGIETVDLTGNANLTATANDLNDVLQSNSGNDTLIAGSGNDTLVGGLGATTYDIGSGSGVTTISEAGYSDILQFGAGITAADLTATQAEAADGSITVTIADSDGASVVIDDYSSGILDDLSFADGSTASLSTLLAALPAGTTGDQTLSSAGWQLGNGSYGSEVANADGSVTDFITDPDGSSSTTTEQTNGDSSTTYVDSGLVTGTRSVTVTANTGGGTTTTTDNDTAVGELESGSVVTTDGLGDSTTVRYGANGSVLGRTVVTVNQDGSVTTQILNASGVATGSSVAVTQSNGSILTTDYDGNGNITGSSDAVVQGSRLTDTTLYNAQGVEIGTSTTTSNGAGDSDTVAFSATGTKVSDTWQNADGTSGSTLYGANGSTTSTVQAPDGSYTTTTADGNGNDVTAQYNVAGVETSDSYQNADGSSGFETFNANGSTESVVTAANGTRTQTSNDGNGNITTTSFSATGQETGFSQVTAAGATTTVVFNGDGSSTDTLNDGQGNVTTTSFNASGIDTGDTWTKADGSSGTDTYNANGSSASTTKNADGTSSTTTVDPAGDTKTTYYNAAGTATSDSFSNANGSSGTDTFNADGSSSGTTVNADGSYSNYVNDGQGDITTTYYNASGTETSETYANADGSSGTVIYNPDGSESGTVTSAAGVTTTFTEDSSGNLVTAGSSVTNADSAQMAALEGSFVTAVSTSESALSQLENGAATQSVDPIGVSVVDSDTPTIQATEDGGVQVTADTTYNTVTQTVRVPVTTTVTSPSTVTYTIEPLTAVSGESYADLPAGSSLVYENVGNGQTKILGLETPTGTTSGHTTTTTTYTTEQVTTTQMSTTSTVSGTIEEIDAGPDTSTIYLGSGQAIVNVGSGNTYVGPDDSSAATDSAPVLESDQELQINETLNVGADETITVQAPDYVTPSLGDFIYGGSGNDTLLGSAGSDTLVAGTGNDFLDGEGGKDTYIINTAVNEGTDIIDDTGYYDPADYTDSASSDIYITAYGGYVPPAPDLATDLLHTVEFNGDVTPDQLQFSWVQVAAAGNRWALDISWGTSASVEVVMADAGLDGEGIQEFTFSDGTTLTLAQMLALAPSHPVDPTPTVSQTLPTLQAAPDVPVNYTLPAKLFTDVDPGDTFTISVQQADGSPLPSWLSYNSQTQTLTGTPPAGDVGTLALQVVGTDISGQTVEAALNVALATDVVTYSDDGSEVTTTLYNASGAVTGVVTYSIYDPTAVTSQFFNADGSYSITVNDGQGDVRTTNYTASGTKTSDSFSQADGTSGTDTYNADGSSSGTTTHSDGTSSSYINDGQGDVKTTNYNAAGTKVSDSFTLADGVSGNDVFNPDGTIASSTLYAGATAVTLTGSSGNDSYFVNNVGDVVQAQGDNNTIYSSVSYTAPDNVQFLEDTSYGSIVLTGNALNDVITANSGADTLVSGTGNDTLVGSYYGGGTYLIDIDAGDTTIMANSGGDTLEFGPGVTASDLSATSSVVDGATVVTIQVTGGNTVTIDNPEFISAVTFADGSTTTLTALSSTNTSTITSATSIVIPAGATNLILTGSADITGTGNALADTITGNSGNDTLIAGAGLATLIGGSGNDTFVIDNASDVISALPGTNTEETFVSTTLAGNVENLTGIGTANLTLTGNELSDVLTANSGNDTLVAGTAATTLVGSSGNDTFAVNNSDDVITESSLAAAGTNDTLEFATGVTPGMLSATLVSNGDFMLTEGTGGGSVTIDGFDPSDPLNSLAVQTFEFADGSSYTFAQLLMQLSNSSSGSIANADGSTTNYDIDPAGDGQHQVYTATTVNASGQVVNTFTIGVNGATDELATAYSSDGSYTTTAVYTPVSGGSTTSTTDYGATGQLLGYQTDFPDGSSDSQSTTYNSDGSYTETQVEISASGSTRTTTVDYSASGQLASEIDVHADGSSDDYTYTYNADGSESITDVSTPTGGGASTTTVTITNAQGQTTEEQTINPDGSSTTDSWTYNSDGSYSETMVSTASGDVPTGTSILDYSSSGQITSTESINADGIATTRDYNTSEQVVSVDTVNPNGATDLITYGYNVDGSYSTAEVYTPASGGSTTSTADYSDTGQLLGYQTEFPDGSSDSQTTTYNSDGSYTETQIEISASGSARTTTLDYSASGQISNDNAYSPSNDGSFSDSWSKSDGSSGTYWWNASTSEYLDTWTNSDGSSFTDEYQYATGGSPTVAGSSYTETYTASDGDTGTRQYDAASNTTTVTWDSSQTGVITSASTGDAGFMGLLNEGELTNTQNDLTYFNPAVSPAFTQFLSAH